MIPEFVELQIEKLEKQPDGSNTYEILDNGVRAYIIPLEENKLALYPDLPIGKSFQVLIFKELDIKGGYRLTITNPMKSNFNVNDVLIAYGDFIKAKFLGKKIINGMAFLE